MNITELPTDIFTGCSQLQYIYLSNNQLTELPASLFGCVQLKYISLSHNLLTKLPADSFARCSKLTHILFDKPIVFGILWSLPNLDKPDCDNYGRKIRDEFPKECALVKRFRRVANDPQSYAWSVRRHVLVGMGS
jgi:hypothetical protein